jgi:hypothetical protein
MPPYLPMKNAEEDCVAGLYGEGVTSGGCMEKIVGK